MIAASWVTEEVWPFVAVVLAAIPVFLQLRKLRQENTAQHAEGRQLIRTLVDKVDEHGTVLEDVKTSVEGVSLQLKATCDRVDDIASDLDRERGRIDVIQSLGVIDRGRVRGSR